MKIFANRPMNALVYIVSAVAIIFTIFVVYHHQQKQQARIVAEQKKAEQLAKAPKVKPVDAKQLKCLTDNIYWEAGNQGTIGQAAVGRVTVNRVNHGFGKNICDVVYRKTKFVQEDEYGTAWTKTLCQFSWVCEENRRNIHQPNYAQARYVAYKILSVDAWNNILPRNTLYFHATSVSPQWNLQRTKQIGAHIFYTNHKIKRN